MPDEPATPQGGFRFTVTDKTFKMVTTIAGVIVIGYRTWIWSIDSAVAARDLQNEHRTFKEILFGTKEEPGGMVAQSKAHHAMLLKLDSDYGKLWSDVEALKKLRDSAVSTAVAPPK